MPEQHQTENLISPADLPAETLITYDDFKHLLPNTNRRMIEAGAKAGRFAPGTRLTPRRPMIWRAGAVAAWLAERTADLEGQK